MFQTMVCDICKRAFRSSTEMTLHRKIHLIGPSNSRLRSYQCSECKYSVRSRNALQRHMEERHGIVESLQGDQNDSDYGTFWLIMSVIFGRFERFAVNCFAFNVFSFLLIVSLFL